jgi:pilus assembly protein CpaB
MMAFAVVALILSLGVFFIAYRILQQRIQPAEVTTKIVVAAKKLDLGHRISRDDVKLVDWPRGTPLEGSFHDIDLVVDRGTMAPLQLNEPLLETKLASREAGVGLMTIIPEGMRALSIQVNSIIGVSGFVLPGSKVDVILTAVPPEGVQGARGEEMGSKIILENLEVLAAGQNVQRDVAGKPQTVQDVTLLLTPDQAQRVALATGDGRIQLALRSPMDKNAAEPPLVVRSKLYEGPTMERPGEKTDVQPPPAPAGTAAVKRPAAAPARKPAVAVTKPLPPRMVEVELIQGAKRTSGSFEDKPPEAAADITQLDGPHL